MVITPAGIVAGNHRHTQQECFIGLGEGLMLAWQDPNGAIHEAPMNPGYEIRLFHIPTSVPHAVANRASSGIATVYELVDAPPGNVERVKFYQV